MEDRLAHLEAKVEELGRVLRGVEERVAWLEAVPGAPPRAATGAASLEEAAGVGAASAGDAPEAASDVVGLLSLIGRTFLALAGAYLLRALTSEGYLPQSVGVGAGLAYAASWLALADRAAARGAAVGAAFHGATAVLLAVPLIWETTVRFAILSAPSSAAALAGLAALALTVAWRRDLRSSAWFAALGTGGAALVLGGSTHVPMSFALFLVLLGVGTWWLARLRSWPGLAWITAALADLAVWLLHAEDPIGRGQATLAGVVSIQLVAFAGYLASFAWAAWRSSEGVTVLVGVQTAAVLLVGYGGAVDLLGPHGVAVVILGTMSLLLAAAFYAVAFLRLERRRRRSALFFTAVAVPLVLVGSALVLPRPAWLWAVLAVVGSAAGSRFDRLTPSLHGAVYALAACVASGVLRQTAAVWTASEFPPLTVDSLMALGATAACLAFPVSGDLSFWRRYVAVPKLVFLVLVVVASGGLAVRALAPLAGADTGMLATLRTAVLASAALGLAATGRIERLREALVLVYPALILGAVKLLVEDFPGGRPETLFIALAFYGGALILAPRLRRAAAASLP